MIKFDGKCPVNFTCERGYNPSPYTSLEIDRAPEKDIMKIQYKNSELIIYPYLPPRIIFVGDKTELALGVALFISQTTRVLGPEIIDDFFTFSNDNLITNWKTTDNFEEAKEFVNEYNRIYPTAILLK